MFSEWGEYFKNIYNPKRFFWLFLSCATICSVVITSEELWNIAKGETIIDIFPLFGFSFFFILTNMIVRINAFNKTIQNLIKTAFFSLITLSFELVFFSSVTMLTLAVLNVSSTKILNTLAYISFTTLPIALGAATLPEITHEYLENKIIQLQRKLENYEEKFNEIEKKDELLEESIQKMQEKRERVKSSDQNE